MSRPLWVRVYRRTDRDVNTLLHVLRGVFDGLWLGVLTPRRTAALDDDYYDTTPQYLDEAYNRQGLWAWEQEIVDGWFPPGGRVAVTGAGGGREVLGLLAQGFDATGYEPNAGLVRFGAALTAADGAGERVLLSGRDGWPAGARDLAAVLVGWGAYMLVPTRAARVALLRAASAATGGTGPVAVSYFLMPAHRVRFRAAVRVAAVLRRLRRLDPPLLGDALSPTYVHYFTPAQVAEEMARAGLEVLGRGTSGAEVSGYGWTVGRAVRPSTTGGHR